MWIGTAALFRSGVRRTEIPGTGTGACNCARATFDYFCHQPFQFARRAPCVISPKMLCAIVGVLALQSPPVGRRAVIRAAAAGALSTSFSALPAFAKPTELASLSNEERLVLAKKRQEAENVAGLPINRLKDKRDRLSTADTLINSGRWTDLRDLLQVTTGAPLSKQLAEQKWNSKEIRIATAKMRKQLFEVDQFAFSQQSFLGGDALSGYCAEGVVPRGTDGCKVKPTTDKAPLLAAVRGALTTFDEIVALVQK